jgi:hypothetical protein
MAKGKKHTAEQIVNLLRQVEVAVANGKTLPQACKEVEIVEQTYYQWLRSMALCLDNRVVGTSNLVDHLQRIAGGPGAAAEGTGTGEREAEAAGE